MVWEACFCRSFPLKTVSVIVMACVPDKRITAMAPFAPGEVAKATMVSCETNPVDMLQRYDYLSDKLKEILYAQELAGGKSFGILHLNIPAKFSCPSAGRFHESRVGNISLRLVIVRRGVELRSIGENRLFFLFPEFGNI